MGRLGGWVTVNDSALLMVTGNVARYDQVGRKFGGRTTLRVKCLCNRCGYYSISWGVFFGGIFSWDSWRTLRRQSDRGSKDELGFFLGVFF